MNPTPDAQPRGDPRQSSQPVRFAGSVLGSQRHVCAFFHTQEERYRVLLPFIQEGFDRGEKAFHIVDPKLRHEHVERLETAGIPVEAAGRNRQLELRNWADAYLLDGHFDQDSMLALIEEVLDGGRQQGFPLTRLIAQMEWALEDQSGVGDLVEYEARLNYVLPRYPDTAICTYDLTKFGGHIVVDIMQTHPMIVIGGTLQENSFFTPPDQFLRELREREAMDQREHSSVLP